MGNSGVGAWLAVDAAVVRDLMQMIRAQYEAQPGLRLSVGQAAKLFTLPQSFCAELLHSLTETRFLARDSFGRYVRSW